MYRNYIKKFFDVIISIFVLILLSPIFMIIAVIIKIFDRGPIIYEQDRTGKDNINFKIYKFRTMKNGKITKIGKFLRKTSLDELPQFFNILKGDMSIIGPRPWIPEYYANFNKVQKRRVDVKPGLIGLAQVNGRKNIDVFKKIEYDINYVENLSFLMDLKIFFRSFKVVITSGENDNNKNYIKKEIEMLKNKKN